MARRSGINGLLAVGYGTVNILKVASVLEAMKVRTSKIVEPCQQVSMAGRSGIESGLKMGYGTVDILEIMGTSEAREV